MSSAPPARGAAFGLALRHEGRDSHPQCHQQPSLGPARYWNSLRVGQGCGEGGAVANHMQQPPMSLSPIVFTRRSRHIHQRGLQPQAIPAGSCSAAWGRCWRVDGRVVAVTMLGVLGQAGRRSAALPPALQHGCYPAMRGFPRRGIPLVSGEARRPAGTPARGAERS